MKRTIFGRFVTFLYIYVLFVLVCFGNSLNRLAQSVQHESKISMIAGSSPLDLLESLGPESLRRISNFT